MHVIRTSGVIVIAIGIAQASFAQGPVAVPIVGSPAAQQPAPPASPVPSVPPPTQIPTQPPFVPPAPIAAAPADTTSRAQQRKLELAFKDGTVVLDAQNVTLREILAEWQRKGGCQFVNADKLPGTQITMQFPAGTSELEAIDSLLHGLATATTGYGYIVGPRSPVRPGQSAFGAVYILPTSRPTASAGYAPSPTGSPIAAPLITPGSPDDEIPPVTPFPPTIPPVPRPGQIPTQPGQPNPAGSTPAPSTPVFGPVAPSAPGAGRIGGPPATPPSGTGRGGF